MLRPSRPGIDLSIRLFLKKRLPKRNPDGSPKNEWLYIPTAIALKVFGYLAFTEEIQTLKHTCWALHDIKMYGLCAHRQPHNVTTVAREMSKPQLFQGVVYQYTDRTIAWRDGVPHGECSLDHVSHNGVVYIDAMTYENGIRNGLSTTFGWLHETTSIADHSVGRCSISEFVDGKTAVELTTPDMYTGVFDVVDKRTGVKLYVRAYPQRRLVEVHSSSDPNRIPCGLVSDHSLFANGSFTLGKCGRCIDYEIANRIVGYTSSDECMQCTYRRTGPMWIQTYSGTTLEPTVFKPIVHEMEGDIKTKKIGLRDERTRHRLDMCYPEIQNKPLSYWFPAWVLDVLREVIRDY
jgi:hypothetical protein